VALPSQKSVFLGIDQSLRSTGIFWLGDGIRGWSLIETKKLRGTERLKFIKDAVLKIITVDLAGYTIQKACMEGYAYGIRGGRVFELGELGGVLKVALTEAGLAVILIVQPTSLKKFTGSGSAEKKDVVEFINRELGLSFTTNENDVADAAVLALIAQQLDTPTTKLRHQLEVLKTIKDSTEG
jgi:Holliday junction resolvasome RuvABC endonuclease subunit